LRRPDVYARRPPPQERRAGTSKEKTMPLRLFQLSSKLFWGYRVRLPLGPASTEEEILREIKASLVLFLEDANLMALADLAKQVTLHLHDDLPALLAPASEKKVFFACDHRHDCLEGPP
jgi:hypothetical protein